MVLPKRFLARSSLFGIVFVLKGSWQCHFFEKRIYVSKNNSCLEKPKEITKAMPLTSKSSPRTFCRFLFPQEGHEGSPFKACLSTLLVVPFWRALLFHPCRHFFQNEGISLGFSKPPSRYFFLVLLSCCFILVNLFTKVR